MQKMHLRKARLQTERQTQFSHESLAAVRYFWVPAVDVAQAVSWVNE